MIVVVFEVFEPRSAASQRCRQRGAPRSSRMHNHLQVLPPHRGRDLLEVELPQGAEELRERAEVAEPVQEGEIAHRHPIRPRPADHDEVDPTTKCVSRLRTRLNNIE